MGKHVKALRLLPHPGSCDSHREVHEGYSHAFCDCGLDAAIIHLERAEKRLTIAKAALTRLDKQDYPRNRGPKVRPVIIATALREMRAVR